MTQTAPIPLYEEERLKELYVYDILDSEPEKDFDHLVELASLICGCEISAISLLDRNRQWFKAKKGIDGNETTRDESICAHAILEDDIFIVENAAKDERFRSLSSVVESPYVRFYAGAPIKSGKGYNIGTVCVVDSKPRVLSEVQIEALKKLSRQASILFEFRRKNEELKRIAKEQQQLKEKAEVAAKAQQQFLSTMSHEIRTPLNGIIGMADILLHENPQPYQVENLESLKFASENLLAIVNDILDYNKLTAGSIQFEKVPFDAYHILQQVTRPHALKAKEKGILFSLETDSGIPPYLCGDPSKLTQVLNNLIGNAVKFTAKGSVQVKLIVAQRTTEKVTIRFEVKDTGIGIRQDKLQPIFEQFTQADVGISRQYGGTGLGLAITKKLLDLQGASIKVTSAEGLGSCFMFTLTFDIADGNIPARIKAGQEAKNQWKGKKILVAEDNALSWMVLQKFLLQWGLAPDHAGNGMNAIEQLKNGPYDLVFMDLQMPELDGYAAAAKIKKEKLFTGPIIAMTADAFIQQDETTANGFTDYILKPFRKEDLYCKLEKHLL